MNYPAWPLGRFLAGVGWDGRPPGPRPAGPGPLALRSFWAAVAWDGRAADGTGAGAGPALHEQFDLEHVLTECRWE